MNKKFVFFVFNDLGLGGVQTKLIDLFNIVEEKKLLEEYFPALLLRERKLFSRSENLKIKKGIVSYRKTFFNNRLRVIFPLHLLIQSLKYKPVSILTSLHLMSMYTIFVERIILRRDTKIIINQDNLLSLDINRQWIKPLITFFYNLSDVIIVQTKIAKKDLVDNFLIKSKKIKVVPNWSLKTLLYSKQKKYDLLYTGRFEPQKNLAVLIDVFCEVLKTFPLAKLCLVGKGSEEDKLRLLIKQREIEKSVTILSPVKNVGPLMSQSKMFILTSLFEGHPLSLVEAMMQEMSPVILNYPGVEEYLINQKTGYFEKTPQLLVERIISLLKNPKKRQEIGVNARLFALDNYCNKPVMKYLSYLGMKL